MADGERRLRIAHLSDLHCGGPYFESNLLERAVTLQPDIIMLNSLSSARSGAVQTLRFEKGMENVLFLVYQ